MQTEGVGLKEIGIGAALMLTLLIIKEVVTSLLKREEKKANESDADDAGSKTPEFWLMEYKEREDSTIRRVEKLIDERIATRLDDIKDSLRILIRWKGGD